MQWHVQREVTKYLTLVYKELVYFNKAVTAYNRLNCETIDVEHVHNIVGR